jgi:hypothetical protein
MHSPIAVASEHSAALLVALVDDVVKVLRLWRVHRFEPEVVQHQEVQTTVGFGLKSLFRKPIDRVTCTGRAT